MQSCASLSNVLQARGVTRVLLLRRPSLPRQLASVRVHTESSDPCPLLEFDISRGSPTPCRVGLWWRAAAGICLLN